MGIDRRMYGGHKCDGSYPEEGRDKGAGKHFQGVNFSMTAMEALRGAKDSTGSRGEGEIRTRMFLEASVFQPSKIHPRKLSTPPAGFERRRYRFGVEAMYEVQMQPNIRVALQQDSGFRARIIRKILDVYDCKPSFNALFER